MIIKGATVLEFEGDRITIIPNENGTIDLSSVEFQEETDAEFAGMIAQAILMAIDAIRDRSVGRDVDHPDEGK